jgi:hypothetical protein
MQQLLQIMCHSRANVQLRTQPVRISCLCNDDLQMGM